MYHMLFIHSSIDGLEKQLDCLPVLAVVSNTVTNVVHKYECIFETLHFNSFGYVPRSGTQGQLLCHMVILCLIF